MYANADLPQFRALSLNHCSVSVRDDTHVVASGGSLAVIHEDTDAREERDGTYEGEAQLVISGEGWGSGGHAGASARTGGGTPP